MLNLEIGDAHFDADVFGFAGAGDDAAIIVTQDDDGLLFEFRAINSFAGAIEVIAVNQGKHEWDSGLAGGVCAAG